MLCYYAGELRNSCKKFVNMEAFKVNSLNSTVKEKSQFLQEKKSNSLFSKLVRDRYLYIMFLPGLIYYIVFRYIPMFGILIAFKDYDPFKGFIGSNWVGLKHFSKFISGPHFLLILRNTLLINIYLLIFAFPVPIAFAILLNELKRIHFKRFVQTVSYLPHFISTVVVVGIVMDLLSPQTGAISLLISKITGNKPIFFMAEPKYFRTIYVLTDIWRSTGWSAVLYIAAITEIDPTLYEAAFVDGANRWNKIIYITIPGILNTIIVLLILNVGYILDVGFETAFLMQNSLNYNNSEVISTFVYRRGLLGTGAGPDFSFSTAVNLLQSIVGLIMIISANKLSRKFSEVSIW